MKCNTGAICSHKPQCEHFCHFTIERTEPTMRRIAPYPIVPDDIEPVPQSWQVIGSVLIGAAFVVLLVICLGLFFTGFWVWSLLI
jgi:hypothetical protein